MTFAGWLQIVLILAITAAAAWGLWPLHGAHSSQAEKTIFSPVLAPVETGIRRICGISERRAGLEVLYACHAGVQRAWASCFSMA